MCLQTVARDIDSRRDGHHAYDNVDQGPEELDFVWYDLGGLFPVTRRGVEGYGCQADGGDGKQEPDGPEEDGCYDWPASLESSQHSGKLSGQHYKVPPKLFQARTIGASR